MDLQSLAEETKEWLESTKSRFSLSHTDSTRKLYFVLPDNELSFFIETPMDSESNDWHVGSDDESLVPRLMEVQDSLDSCKKRSLSEVLKLATGSLDMMSGALAVSSGEDDDDCDDDDCDDDDDDDFYYNNDAGDLCDMNQSGATSQPSRISGDEETADDFFTGEGSPAAVQRLVSDLKIMKKDSKEYGIEGSPRNDNLFLWDVKLTNISTDTKLGKDLHAYAKKFKREPVVSLEVKFPADYPMSPPFVRVIRPRFRFLTGHVTVGGSICMEMLTKSGWMPTNDIEKSIYKVTGIYAGKLQTNWTIKGIMIQVRCEILSDPNASLDTNPDRAYDEAEARSAFERMVMRYGWDK